MGSYLAVVVTSKFPTCLEMREREGLPYVKDVIRYRGSYK